MIGFILDHIPWQVWAGLGIVGVMAIFVVLRSLGFTMRQTIAAMATFGLAMLAATIYQKGRREGVRSAEERQRQADQKAATTREEIEDAVAGRTPKENRDRLWVRALPLLFVMLALAGCGSVGGFCKAAKPIYATPEDVPVISDRLVEQLNAHNETGAELCGWTR